jgi:hypothetical protein
MNIVWIGVTVIVFTETLELRFTPSSTSITIRNDTIYVMKKIDTEQLERLVMAIAELERSGVREGIVTPLKLTNIITKLIVGTPETQTVIRELFGKS